MALRVKKPAICALFCACRFLLAVPCLSFAPVFFELDQTYSFAISIWLFAANAKLRKQLKNPFRDGTTHILFSPLDFLSKLAALVPKPRHNLVRYHGVFAANAKLRKQIVPKNDKRRKKVEDKGDNKTRKKTEQPAKRDELVAPLTWAQRLKRVFNIDITLCPICGGTMRVIDDITDPDIIQKILDHLTGPPRPQPPPIKPATAIQS
tara:strand:+ start:456 stop:1076 length:621 start_codon:yes stop_codon:yes gene_type:complete